MYDLSQIITFMNVVHIYECGTHNNNSSLYEHFQWLLCYLVIIQIFLYFLISRLLPDRCDKQIKIHTQIVNCNTLHWLYHYWVLSSDSSKENSLPKTLQLLNYVAKCISIKNQYLLIQHCLLTSECYISLQNDFVVKRSLQVITVQ